MAKEVISVGGQDRVVREDTAKAYRGVNWALVSVAAFILITAFLAVVFLFSATNQGNLNSPQEIDNTRSR
ncbi:MAG: hypothetical protein JO053_11475 [Acidobacteria bacterium]|nr:hypothetical protein [Acidobacteriota bacterium]